MADRSALNEIEGEEKKLCSSDEVSLCVTSAANVDFRPAD